MKLDSKVNANDNVWFFLLKDNGKKFFEGTVQRVMSWNEFEGFKYLIDHIDSEGELKTYEVTENNVYKTKTEITNTVFEPNGTPKSTEPNE